MSSDRVDSSFFEIQVEINAIVKARYAYIGVYKLDLKNKVTFIPWTVGQVQADSPTEEVHRMKHRCSN